jgi:hypothetical protein
VCCISYSQAQIVLKGQIISNDSLKKPIEGAEIYNPRTVQFATSDDKGAFILNVQEGDSLIITHISYVEYVYKIKQASASEIKRTLFMLPKRTMIPGIRASAMSQYQRDSLKRARMFSGAVNYEQKSDIRSPVTSLYEQFSKKYKDLRKLQARIQSDEEQKYIDTKYTYEIVNSVTKLEGDSAANFMIKYPMEYKFARLASETEMKMWIMDNFKKYKVFLQMEANRTKPQ